jgi:hypothetical protein
LHRIESQMQADPFNFDINRVEPPRCIETRPQLRERTYRQLAERLEELRRAWHGDPASAAAMPVALPPNILAASAGQGLPSASSSSQVPLPRGRSRPDRPGPSPGPGPDI